MLDVIKRRRSIRYYKSTPLPWKKIIEIVDAARHAPTAGNLQNFQLVYVDKPDLIDKLSNSTSQEWLKTSKGVFIVCVDYNVAKTFFGENGKLLTDHSIGAVIENMLLEATNQGLGSCWVEDFDKEFVKKEFGIKTEPVALITLGVPNEKPEEKKLKDFYEFLFYNSFGTNLFDIREKLKSPRVIEDIEDLGSNLKRFFKKLMRKK